jgi:hypothetical protein
MTSPPKTLPLCRVHRQVEGYRLSTMSGMTDSLAAATTANAQIEGADATDATVTATTRIGNYTQIVGKTIRVSGTLEAVDKAGRKSEKAYQMAKAAAEMKRDIETIITANQGQSAGNATTARVMGSLLSYIKTNSSVNGTSVTGVDPTTDWRFYPHRRYDSYFLPRPS